MSGGLEFESEQFKNRKLFHTQKNASAAALIFYPVRHWYMYNFDLTIRLVGFEVSV